MALAAWVCVSLSSMALASLSFVGVGCSQSLWVVFVVAGRSMSSVGCWPSFAVLCLLCVWLSIGRLLLSSLGGWVRLCWGLRDVAAGDVEGALVVVDAGDVGV